MPCTLLGRNFLMMVVHQGLSRWAHSRWKWAQKKAQPREVAPFWKCSWDLEYVHKAMGLVEGNRAVLECEECPVTTHSHVLACVELGAALADEDVAGENGLTTELLYAEALGVTFTPVA